MAKKLKETGVVTNEVRFSYANVFTPKAAQEGAPEKYSISLLIPKSDTETIELIEQAIEAAKQKGKEEKWSGKMPPRVDTTFRDGDEEKPDQPEYQGHMFLNCTSNRKPSILKKVQGSGPVEITDEDEFYSGCYGKASVNFFAYNASGKKGISAGLQNLLKTKDGERFGGKSDPMQDFADEFDEDDLLD